MKKRQLYLLTINLLLSVCGQAQFTPKVQINLPHFANKPYVFYLMMGDSQDTIRSGVLDQEGKTVLTIPEQHQAFAGMSKWMIVGEGGLEIILNRENEFTVSCTEALPDINNIYYIGTAENEFLFAQYKKQEKVLGRADAITRASQLYDSPEDALYQTLKTERNRLYKQFAELQSATARSPFYSARIREMSNFLIGLGSRLDMTDDEIRNEQRAFVLSKVDFRQLYNSGLWGDVLDLWIGMETGWGDSLLIADSRTMLARCTDQELHPKLVNKLIVLYNKYGKENLLPQLGVENLIAPGHYAPKLRLQNAYIMPIESLVIFYESGCSNCETELVQLRANYRTLQEKGLRVISVAADQDEEIYRKNAALFPWPDAYCDYKGFSSENFTNYQVVGTPTIFVVDKAGMITGRFARLAEYLDETK
jgi:hypothetical protein